MTENVRQAAKRILPLAINPRLFSHAVLLWVVASLWAGCAGPTKAGDGTGRRFEFSKDTFAYANGLVWEYRYDDNGKWTTRRREPKPSYSQHCFVVSRSACQFFENARFDSTLPKADDDTYRHLVRRVVSSSLGSTLPRDKKIIIPGYPDLRSFSHEHERLLQAECGGAWRCYFQRGNWRMILPFSRHQQEHVAEKLQQQLQHKGPVVVHVVRFPDLSINHAVVIFDAKSASNRVDFVTYDPNEPAGPTNIRFDCATRTFHMQPNAYFPGGWIDVYPIYDRFPY